MMQLAVSYQVGHYLLALKHYITRYRGAVLRGTYGNAITSQKARRNYGVPIRYTF